jgi:signal transduction histidine kinase
MIFGTGNPGFLLLLDNLKQVESGFYKYRQPSRKIPRMKLLNKLFDFLGFDLREKCEERELNNITYINLLSFAGYLFLTVFGTLAVIRGDLPDGLAAFLVSILLLGSIWYVRKTLNYSFTAKINLTLIIVFLFTILAFGHSEESIIIWFPIVPVLSIFLLGYRNGGVISLAFLLITIIFFTLPDDLTYKTGTSVLVQSGLLGLYLVLHAISTIVEYNRIRQVRLVEMQLLESGNQTKLKESFISKLSHQIRTPLSNIMLVGHMVDKLKLSVEQKDMIGTIIASANNLVNTIENIAEIAEVDIEGKRNMQNIGFNLYTAINSTVKLFTVQKEALVEFTLSVHERLKEQDLEGDPVRLKQIFLNLIETILKHKRPGKINISILVNIHNQKGPFTEVRFEIKTNKPIKISQGINESGESDIGYLDSNHADFINYIDLLIAKKIILQLGGNCIYYKHRKKTMFFFSPFPFKPSACSIIPEKTGHPSEKESAEAELDYLEKLKEMQMFCWSRIIL